MFDFELLKKSAWLSLTGFLLPVKPFFIGIIGLIIIDILSGMYVAYFVKNESLTSKRFFGKIKQIAAFAVGLWAMLLADKNLEAFGLTDHWGVKMFCALYTFYELFSILENLGNAGLPIAKEIQGLLLNKKNQALDKEGETKDGK